MTVRRTALVLYLPVLHRGYLELLRRYRGAADICYVLGDELVAEHAVLHSEIRALDAETARFLVSVLGNFPARILTQRRIAELAGQRIVLPREGISERFAQKYLPGEDIVFETVFLRWDETNVATERPARYHRISTDMADRELMALARRESDRSSDWWRHVGAILARNGAVVLSAHNRHRPSEHTPYAVGDPRDVIAAGENLDLASTNHAEISLLASAAREGIPTRGADLFVTAFPCPRCANALAESGIARCFFESGSARLDGAGTMEAAGIELVLVQ